jgi:uncharacterized membrane protein YbhN (UPF0104 family)
MLARRNARWGGFVAAIAVVAVCLFYLGTRFDWREPLRVVRDADLLALAGATFAVHFAYICVRTLRWQLVVRDRHPAATFGTLYWITAIVVSLAILTPGQIGETAKVELLKRRGLGGRLAGLGSFALERVLDILTIAGFGLIGLAFGTGLSDRYPQLPAVAAVLFVAGLVVLYALGHSRTGSSTDGWLAVLRSGTGTSAIKVRMLALTIASWCLIGLGWQISLRMVGIDVSLPAVCWLVSLITLSTLVSLMPGGIGLADVVTIQALLAMGASPTAAQAGALILRVYALIGIAFGLCHLLAWPLVPRALRGQES